MPGIETIMKVLGDEVDRLKEDLNRISEGNELLLMGNRELRDERAAMNKNFAKLDDRCFAWREKHYRLLMLIDEKNKTLKKKIEVPPEVRDEPGFADEASSIRKGQFVSMKVEACNALP